MDAIEVTARFDLQGDIHPISFTCQGKTYQITSTGRHWQDEQGKHILVMIPGERVVELVFDPTRGLWFLNPTGPERGLA